MCARWDSPSEGFAFFLADMGERPDGHTLDRIDNDGNYEPGNCRWATRSEQNRNTRGNVILEHDGRSMTLVEWSEETGIDERALRQRIVYVWTVERALTTPVRKRTRRKT